jgi:SAM-dependent methyltransferase
VSTILEQYVSWKGWNEDGFGHFDDNSRRYYGWHIHRAIGAGQVARVLEIGFGNGSFLGYCASLGFEVFGIELDSALRERAARRGVAVASSVAELRADQRFELIALFDVFEHISTSELIVFMTSLAGHLSPDGRILLRVPNGDSPFGRQFQHGDLTHVSTYGIGKLRQLAELAGLKIVAIGDAPWNAQQDEPPGVRALARAAIRFCIDRLLGFAYYRNNIGLDKNLTAVLALVSSPRPASS